MGAAVFQPAAQVHARKVMSAFKDRIGKTNWKHATELGHAEKVLLGRTLGKVETRLFAVISKKSTLGEYKEQINADPQYYYNKCLQYLLERVLAYLRKYDPSQDEISIVLEERNHDYDRMIRFLQKVKDNPVRPESKSLEILNPFAIVRRKKGEDLLLEVADFVSHAVFQLANKSVANFQIPEPRYFMELSSRFAGNDDCRVLGTGLKCIHSLQDLELDPDIERLVRSVRCKPPKSHT